MSDLASFIAAVAHSVHEKYSPNLHRWLVKESKRTPGSLTTGMGPNGINDTLDCLYIGWRDEDGWFMGSAVRRILTVGVKADVFAHPPADVIEGGSEFWADYLKDGRCALDREHKRYFLNADGRFTEDGDIRTCNWCGFTQHRVRWIESVPHQRWSPLPPEASRLAVASHDVAPVPAAEDGQGLTEGGGL